MSLISKWVRAFGHFWWDFLVGDTPELFVGMLIIVGVAFLVHNNKAVAVVVVPVVAIIVLLTSTVRGRKRA
jgi:hypothetical protein